MLISIWISNFKLLHKHNMTWILALKKRGKKSKKSFPVTKFPSMISETLKHSVLWSFEVMWPHRLIASQLFVSPGITPNMTCPPWAKHSFHEILLQPLCTFENYAVKYSIFTLNVCLLCCILHRSPKNMVGVGHAAL